MIGTAGRKEVERNIDTSSRPATRKTRKARAISDAAAAQQRRMKRRRSGRSLRSATCDT